MFTESSVYDLITVLQDGQIQLRRADSILKDGVVVSKSYDRTVLVPGQDVSSYPQNVQDIAAVAWTAPIIAAYQAKMAAI